jgi:ssDNA-binding Zn-finger/Zn-ribbon topoisomerase 1
MIIKCPYCNKVAGLDLKKGKFGIVCSECGNEFLTYGIDYGAFNVFGLSHAYTTTLEDIPKTIEFLKSRKDSNFPKNDKKQLIEELRAIHKDFKESE